MVHTPSPSDDIAWQQALDWVMLIRDGMLDALGEQQLLEWLDRSPRHIECFRQACVVWQVTGGISPATQAALESRLKAPFNDPQPRHR